MAQGLRCFVFMREDYKVEPFADVRAKAGLSSTFLKTQVLVRQGIEPRLSTPPSGTYTQPTELTRLYDALYTDWKNLEEKLNSHKQQQ